MSKPNKDAAPAPVRVRVTAADRGTEILIIDAAFAKVAAGVGEVEHALSPGIYKARFKTCDRMEDKLFEVRDRPLTIQGGLLAFSSPVPLAGSSNNHEYQFEPARALAAAPVTGSEGTELFVFARDSSHPYGKPHAVPPPWTRLSLLDACGKPLADIEQQGQGDPASGFVSIKLALQPGLYFLAQPDFALNKHVMLPVVLCRGWCTHVYIDSTDHTMSLAATTRGPQRVLDLAGSAVLMMHPQDAEGWNADTFRLTEIARQGLMRGRKAVSTEDLDLMIHGKARFPMLGLYAAHMLLARPEKDWEKICIIASHLDDWLGSPHPDVELLLKLCNRHVETPRKARPYGMWPPMLAASWDEASAEKAEPAGKLRSRGQLLRQYRLGGSMWSCLLIPEGAVLPGPTETAPRRLKSKSGGGISAMMSAIDLDEVALQALGSATAAAKGAFGRHFAGLKNTDSASAETMAAEGDTWNLKMMLAGLTRPNPAHTPFQQALRRRLLDLMADDDAKVSARDLFHHLHDLARQFRLDKADAKEAFNRLLKNGDRPH